MQSGGDSEEATTSSRNEARSTSSRRATHKWQCTEMCSALVRRVVDPVRCFTADAAEEDLYVTYAHRSVALRLGTLLVTWSLLLTLYVARRGHTWDPDQPMPTGFASLIALAAVSTIGILATLPVVTRRAAAALGPTGVASLPPLLRRVITTDGALAFEAVLVGLVAVGKLIELFVVGSEPLPLMTQQSQDQDAQHGSLVQPLVAAWYFCAASPPRFAVLGPFLLVFLPVNAIVTVAWLGPTLTGSYTAATMAALMGSASIAASVAALWAWDAQRRSAFRTLQTNVDRTAATRSIVSALSSISEGNDANVTDEKPLTLTAFVVVVQLTGSHASLTERYHAVTALLDAAAKATQVTGTAATRLVVVDGKLIALFGSDDRAPPDADDAAEGNRTSVTALQAAFWAQATLRSVEAMDDEASAATSARSPSPCALRVDEADAELQALRESPSIAGGCDFCATMTHGTVDVALPPLDAPVSATAVRGDAVLRAMDVASLCAPAGKVVLSEEVRALLTADFATAYVRSYVPRRIAETGDEDSVSRVGIYVRGVPWSRSAQAVDERLRAQIDDTSVSSDDASPPSARTGWAFLNVAAHKRSALSGNPDETIEPEAPPRFAFRFPWGYQFDDAELEADFRRVEHAGAARLPVASYALCLYVVMPAIAFADGSDPDAVGYALWALRTLLGIGNVAACAVRRPGPRVLVAHTLCLGLLASLLAVPQFQHMRRTPTFPLAYESQTQYLSDMIATLFVTPSALPWWLVYFASLLGNVDMVVVQPTQHAVSVHFLVGSIALTLASLAFTVYAVRLRQRHAFAAVVASERAVEAWAVRRQHLERRLELLTWPCVARSVCDAVAAGASLEPQTYSTAQVRISPGSRWRPMSALELRNAALTVYSHPTARNLSAAVEVRADCVVIIADSTRADPSQLLDAVREALASWHSALEVRALPASTAMAGLVFEPSSDAQTFLVVHEDAEDSLSH